MTTYIWSTEITNAYIWIPNPESIVLDRSYIRLSNIWDTAQLTATIEPTVSDHSITWSSDDTTVATVSTTWLVTCVTPWECTITATTVNGLTASCGVAGWWLPSAYQEVEWIGSSWTQRINTGYVPDNKTKAEWKMWNWTETGSHCIFGIMYSFWSNPWRWFSIVTDAYMFNNSAWVTHWMNNGSVHTWELSQAWLFVDWVLKTTPATSTFTCPNNLLLFCTSKNWSPSEYSTFRYYYYKLYDDGTLVRDFVPCYRIADWEIWMYDVVNDVFYTNSWSWTFTKWPNV